MADTGYKQNYKAFFGEERKRQSFEGGAKSFYAADGPDGGSQTQRANGYARGVNLNAPRKSIAIESTLNLPSYNSPPERK